MAAADYRLLTEATGQRIAAALESLVNLGDPVTIAHGGTGASTAAAALLALGGVAVTDIVDNLTSTVTDKPLSAAQGKALNDSMHTATPETFTPIDNAKVQISSYSSFKYHNVYVLNFTCKALQNINIWEYVLNWSCPISDSTTFVGSVNNIPSSGSIATNGNINFGTAISANQYFSGTIVYIAATSN